MNGQKKRLRIAFIGARGIGAPYSGIETYYEEVGSRLAAAGHEVAVYCRRHFTPAGADPLGMHPVFTACARSKHGETFTHTMTATWDVALRGADIVQYHALGPALFSALPRLRGARTVASIRGLDWKREKWGLVARSFLQLCERTSYRFPNATSVVSRTLREYYREQYGADVAYIPNGVRFEETPPVQELASLGLSGGDFVLFLGRISPEKGCDTLIDAYRRVEGRTKLVLAGHSSYTDGYIEALRRTAPPGVIFPGQVTGRLRAELLGHCAAFVLPSSIEGLSVALLEAMAFGRCVVTTDIPENTELVDGIGLTAPVGDVDGLAAALKAALDDPADAALRGRRAQELVRSEYSWDEVARRTEALYYRTLDGEPAAG